MATASIVLDMLGSEERNAEISGSLSIASELSNVVTVVRGGTQILHLAWLLRRLNGNLKSFFGEIYKQMDNQAQGSPVRNITKDEIASTIRSLRDLAGKLDQTYDRAKRARFTNYTLLAGSLSRLHTYAEDLSELADWADMALNPESHDQIFKRAEQEKERGEIFSLSQVD